MSKFREKIARFMMGRYGMDYLSRMLIYVSLFLLIITLFTNNSILYALAVILMIYAYFRTFSKNVSKRYAENQAYLKVRYKVIAKFNRFRARCKDSKTHKIFRCPGCGQKIRVPKHKGRISIKCPKCRIEFIKKT